MSCVLVQGASRGLGLAFVRQLCERRAVERVFASSRRPADAAELVALEREHPGRVHTVALDLTDEDSVAEAARRIGELTARLHAVINVAGILHGDGIRPERRLEHVRGGQLVTSFAINAIGPLLIAKHFLSLLNHDERAVFASLSARVGSIGDNRLGGWYGYRASKAAQNMFTKTLSLELARRAPNVICVALHPGTVDTDLSRPFQRSVPADQLFTPQRAARQLLDVIDSLTADDSGRFLDWKRESIPW